MVTKPYLSRFLIFCLVSLCAGTIFSCGGGVYYPSGPLRVDHLRAKDDDREWLREVDMIMEASYHSDEIWRPGTLCVIGTTFMLQDGPERLMSQPYSVREQLSGIHQFRAKITNWESTWQYLAHLAMESGQGDFHPGYLDPDLHMDSFQQFAIANHIFHDYIQQGEIPAELDPERSNVDIREDLGVPELIDALLHLLASQYYIRCMDLLETHAWAQPYYETTTSRLVWSWRETLQTDNDLPAAILDLPPMQENVVQTVEEYFQNAPRPFHIETDLPNNEEDEDSQIRQRTSLIPFSVLFDIPLPEWIARLRKEDARANSRKATSQEGRALERFARALYLLVRTEVYDNLGRTWTEKSEEEHLPFYRREVIRSFQIVSETLKRRQQ